MNKRYLIRNKWGWELESFPTIEEAIDRINEYENGDAHEQSYTPNFYEVYDTVYNNVVWP